MFQATCEAIEEHPNHQIIGVYVAPLREHLSVPNSVASQYPDIPVYQLNSLEMKTTEENINLYKKWIPLILKNKKFLAEYIQENTSHEKIQENQQKLDKVKNVITRLEFISESRLRTTRNLMNSETTKAIRELNNLVENFLSLSLIVNCFKKAGRIECLKLIEIFFPLYLLRDKSGILMLTYEKFETRIPYLIDNGEKWVKKSRLS